MRLILHEDTIKKLRKFVILENKNQAIVFLKEKGLDPNSSEKGKDILNNILAITKGDGYTNLLTRFFVNERFPLNELTDLHTYLKNNNKLLLRLPKNVVDYQYYRDLRRDIDDLEGQMHLKRTYNEFPSSLKAQFNTLPEMEKNHLKDLSIKLNSLPKEHKTYVFKKISQYKDIRDYIRSLEVYLASIESGSDYTTIKEKILSTEGALMAYDNPESNILIAHITSFTASKTVGCTSSWCITRDAKYWRDYKKGGNFYFYIWDFNYPPQDNRSMIGTAFNVKEPGKSQTHYKDDTQTKLPGVLEDIGVDVSVLSDYIVNFKQNIMSGAKGGFMTALNNFKSTKGYYGDRVDTSANDDLLENVKSSQFIAENSNPDDVEVDSYYGTISLGIDGQKLCDALEISKDDYDYVSGYADNRYGSYYEEVDSTELDYMGGYLNESNINLLIQLAKMFGEKSDVYENFREEEKLREFLEKYELTGIGDIFLEELGNAQTTALEQEAKDVISKIPIDIDDGTIRISTIIDYITNETINPDTFDELIEHIKSNMPDLGYESIEDARYQNADFDQLNSKIEDKLKDIIDEMENDPDSEYHKKYKFYQESIGLLEKIGFSYDLYKTKLSYQQPNKTIVLINSYYDEDREEPMGVFELLYSGEYYAKKGQDQPIDKRIKIPIKKIVNYVDQHEFSLYESKLKLMNVLSESIKQLTK